MKAILEFNLPEELEEYSDAIKGYAYREAFEQVWEQIFRPRYKHGHKNEVINAILLDDKAQALMDYLEEIYLEIKEGVE